MAKHPTTDAKSQKAGRLAEALRANLRRRKQPGVGTEQKADQKIAQKLPREQNSKLPEKQDL